MHKQILIVLLLLIAFSNASAQTVEEATVAASSSRLTAVTLPEGAFRVKDANVPAEINEVLEKLVAQGGSRVRRGGTEVLMWGGDYQRSKGSSMIERLANALRGAGWEYEFAAEDDGVTFFTVIRQQPSRRALVGFFAPTDEAFVLALTEMLPNDGSNASSDQTPGANEEPANGGGGTAENNLVGKWKRTGGAGGFRDYTGKTQYNSGEEITFEFFADGSMQFLNEKNTLSITQCRISEVTKIPGAFTVSGDEVTMNLETGTSIGKSSCEAAGNFTKRLSASSATKKFVVKQLNSVFRPDRPVVLCFDGAEDKDCFERTGK